MKGRRRWTRKAVMNTEDRMTWQRGLLYIGQVLMAIPFALWSSLGCKHTWSSAGMLPGCDGRMVLKMRCSRCPKTKLEAV